MIYRRRRGAPQFLHCAAVDTAGLRSPPTCLRRQRLRRPRQRLARCRAAVHARNRATWQAAAARAGTISGATMRPIGDCRAGSLSFVLSWVRVGVGNISVSLSCYVECGLIRPLHQCWRQAGWHAGSSRYNWKIPVGRGREGVLAVSVAGAALLELRQLPH